MTLKPIFYRQCVDNLNCRKKNIPDELFFKLNNYHRNIKLTIETSPTKFLDKKLPVPWSSNISKRYKRNEINGELHCANQIATDFEKEIVQTKEKFPAANFPSRFKNNVCNDFLNKENNHKNIDFTIPPGFFDVKPPFILIEIPY